MKKDVNVKCLKLPVSVSKTKLATGIKKWGYAIFRAVFLIAVGYIVMYPILYMLAHAFIDPSEALDPSILWLPKTLSSENFARAFEVLEYPRAFMCSFLVLIIPALIEVFTCAVAAYGFSRFNFKGKGIFFAIVILTMIIPPQSMLASMFLNYSHLDFFGILGAISKLAGTDLRPSIIDTPLVFWLPAIFGVGIRSGLFIFIYRQFFNGLPKELEEAAYIDGAGPFKTFLKIVLPSSGAAIICVLLFSIIWYWNEYDQSAMFMSDNFPLPIMIVFFGSNTVKLVGQYNTMATQNFAMAGSLLFILPVLVFYLIIQRKFVQSISRVGIVG